MTPSSTTSLSQSSLLEKITPLILTYNEAPNIQRTLQQLTWAKQVIIIDSFSDDNTLQIIRDFPNTNIFQKEFKSFADQCNFGLTKVETEWVLSLDADYILSDHLIEELRYMASEAMSDSFFVNFKYCIFGKSLRGTLLPPRKILYKKELAEYQDDGHAHRVFIRGSSTSLKSRIYHDDRKSLSRWLWAQDRYMVIEAQKLSNTAFKNLSWGDRIRKLIIPAPFIILFYCLILKGGILDGWRGFYYAFQRMLAEILLSIRLIELKFNLNTESNNEK